jgi:hypothetical protein
VTPRVRPRTKHLSNMGVVDDPHRGRRWEPWGVSGGREEPGHRNRHPDRPVSPPTPALSEELHKQRQGMSNHEAVSTGPPDTSDQSEAAAFMLVDAFYRGLGAAPAATTTSIRRRDLVIARQLVAVGATAEEAEAYARDMISKGGRMAPVDLRSFERERLGWRAQRRGQQTHQNGLRVVTGTGLSD